MSTQQQALQAREATSRTLTILFSLVVLCTCAWVLSLPVFPSQDGPLHLYYVDVFARFLAHSPGVYARFYRVGSVLPPYALYYYVLILLGKVVSLPTADKIVVCASILLNSFGFRYLARRIGAAGDRAAFLLLPVLLSWPLAMGFVNFTLSFGLALWGAGLWARFDDEGGRRRQVAFIALLYLITVTHPIPLALLLLGCGIQLVVRAIALLAAGTAPSRALRTLLPRVVCLAASAPALLYIRRFTVRDVLEQGETLSLHRRLSDNLFNYLHGTGLLIFPGDSAGTTVYRAGVGVLVLLALLLGARHAWRCWQRRRIDTAACWFVVAIVSIALLPLLPRDLNGSHFLAWRLVMVVYLAIALATAGADAEAGTPWLPQAVVAVSVLLSAVVLVLAAGRMGTAAHRIAALTRDGQVTPGTVGVLVQAGPNSDSEFTFRPYLWAGAHFFRRNQAVLYNSAWLDLPVITLKRNEETNLLEPTADQRPPRFSDPAALFQPGARWNPADASFFFVEQIRPSTRPSPQDGGWRGVESPVQGLSLASCKPEDWYCVLARR